MNKEKGYIALYRSVCEHYLYPNHRVFTEFEAWIDLLLMVNHKDNNILLDMQKVTILRSQVLTSEFKLGMRWLWSRAKVRNFLKLLEKDKMILREPTTKYTKITICKYEEYQPNKTTEKQQKDIGKTSKEQQKNTNNNDKNEEEIINNIYSAYPTKCPIRGSSNGKSEKSREKIKRLLDKYSSENLLKIIKGYIDDCEKNNVYMKNFDTFLNNLPTEFLNTETEKQTQPPPKEPDGFRDRVDHNEMIQEDWDYVNLIKKLYNKRIV